MFKYLGIFLVAIGIGVLAIRLAPVYVQNIAVKKIAQQVVSDSELSDKPRRAVLKRVSTLFQQNDITSLDAGEVVSVKRDNAGDWVLGVKYEQRRKLMYNLEIVAAFDDQITN